MSSSQAAPRCVKRGILFVGACLAPVLLAGCGYFDQPPVAAFRITPTSGEVPCSLVFDASESSDPNGGALEYSWAFDDGSQRSGRVVKRVFFSGAGTREVTLTVTATGGSSTASGTFVLRARPPAEVRVGDLVSCFDWVRVGQVTQLGSTEALVSFFRNGHEASGATGWVSRTTRSGRCLWTPNRWC